MEETRQLLKDPEHYADLDVENSLSESSCDSSYANEKSFRLDNSSSVTSHTASFLTWSRWLIVTTLQMIIIILILTLWQQRPPARITHERDTELRGKIIETGDDVNGLYATTSHSYTHLTFEPEKYFPNTSSNVDREQIRQNWNLLMPRGSGSVAIPEYKNHPLLGNPITDDPLRSGPLYEASWTHALHCLYYAVDSYHQLILHGPSEADNPHHAAHCFEYLRTSILCNLDMTLEGELSTPAESARGQPHVCRNRDEAVAWIEERRVDDLQDIVGPTAIVKDEERR